MRVDGAGAVHHADRDHRRPPIDAGASDPAAHAPASQTDSPARPVASRLRRPFPFHPLLLAAYPVLFLFSENLAEVAFGRDLPAHPARRGGAAAIAIVAGLLLRDIRRGALVASAMVVVWFTYGQVAGWSCAPMGVSRDVQLALSLAFVLLFVFLAATSRTGHHRAADHGRQRRSRSCSWR